MTWNTILNRDKSRQNIWGRKWGLDWASGINNRTTIFCLPDSRNVAAETELWAFLHPWVCLAIRGRESVFIRVSSVAENRIRLNPAKRIFHRFPCRIFIKFNSTDGLGRGYNPQAENAAVARNIQLVLFVAAMQGTFFVHAGDKGFHIGPGIPTNVPVSEIRAVGYDGPRTIEEESVADLKKWFEDRLEDGFKFDLLDGVDGT